MTIEIWSDIVCPFCYMGKRKFESALAQFSGKDQVRIIWKSFQLQPQLQTDPAKNATEHLAASKGWSLEQTRQIEQQVTQAAAQVGLTYRFDKAKVANTFRAHSLLHFAKANGKQSEVKELLLKAYFTEGQNIDDPQVLAAIAAQAGLDADECLAALSLNTYQQAVRNDIQEAQQLGINGVPFFVFDRKYAVSGAQEPTVFLQTLEQSFAEWQQAEGRAVLPVTEGPGCTPEGACD